MNPMVENKNVQNMVLKKDNKSNVALLEGSFFRDGKKQAASKAILSVLRVLKRERKQPVSLFLDAAVTNSYPFIVMRAKKIGGSVYQIPVHLHEEKQNKVAVNWLLTSCGTKLGSRLLALHKELVSASSNEGCAAQKKKSLHTLAVSNRAYIKYL